MEIPEPVYKLANDPKIARNQREIVRPLRSEGISELQLRDGERIVDVISKSEADYFYVNPITDELGLTSQIIEAILTLRAPVFVSGERWQFFYGETRIATDISDQRFLKKVLDPMQKWG